MKYPTPNDRPQLGSNEKRILDVLRGTAMLTEAVTEAAGIFGYGSKTMPARLERMKERGLAATNWPEEGDHPRTGEVPFDRHALL
jgi:hypothetical protein